MGPVIMIIAIYSRFIVLSLQNAKDNQVNEYKRVPQIQS